MTSFQHAYLKQLEKLLLPAEVLFVSNEWRGAPTKPQALDQWPWERQSCSFRSLLQREVLFDFDAQQWKDVVTSALAVQRRLEAVGCPYYMYNSGGKGWHIHVFLDAQGVEHVTSWKQLRIAFWEWATSGVPNVDRIKVIWNTFSVVRTEGALRRIPATSFDELFSFRLACKSLQDSIPLEKPKPSRSARFPEHLSTFALPASFLLTLENENGLGICEYCDVPLSQTSVVYDEFCNNMESVTCSICKTRQWQASRHAPLEGEWRYAFPADWLPS